MKYCCKLDIDDMVITSNEVIEKDNGIPQFDHIIFILKRGKKKRTHTFLMHLECNLSVGYG